MRVYICEKPSQAKDYAKALNVTGGRGDGFIDCGKDTYITWCFGHLLDTLSPKDYGDEYKKWTLESLPLFPRDRWDWVVAKDKKKQYSSIKKLVDKADEVYIASDADREGELIVVSLLERMKFKGKRMRVWTGALDEVSVRRAIEAAKDASLTYSLYVAAVTRQKADWIHGLNLTRGMSVANQPYIDGVFSIGRVQTSILNLIVNRDFEIENFKPKDYYNLTCKFTTDAGDLNTTWNMPKSFHDPIEEKCLDKEKIKVVSDKVSGKDGLVIKSQKVRKEENHPLLYSLASLQKECSSLWGMSASDVLKTAQSLYETHKATTYPRTSSEYLNDEQLGRIDKTFESMKASDSGNAELKDHLSRADRKIKSRVWNSAKVEAHHAIIPNIAKFDINQLSSVEKKVYDLIRRRYIAQFFPKAQNDSSTIEVKCEDEIFKISGNAPVSLGWKEVLKKKSETKDIPLLNKGDIVKLAKPKVNSKKTSPPARFNDGSLIDAMLNAGKFVDDKDVKKQLTDIKGIGTDATRSTIIDVLFSRDFIKKDKKHVISTEKGRALISCAPEETKSLEMTAFWEGELEKIANGKVKSEDFLKTQEDLLTKIMNDIKAGKCTLKKSVGSLYTCPTCDGGLRKTKKSPKTGLRYWVCKSPDCNTIFKDNRGKPDIPKTIDQGTVEHICEKCNVSKLVRLKGNDNTYWKCSGKDCNQTYTDDNMIPKIIIKEVVDQGTEAFKCYKCKKGDLKRNKGPYGYYWKCQESKCGTNFKDVDFKPLKPAEKATSEFVCPTCKKGHLVKRKGPKGDFWGCNNYPKCKTAKQDKDGKPEGM